MSKDKNFNDIDNLENRIKELRKFQYNTGRTKSGISSKCSPNFIPTWFEPDSFRRAQQLFQNYSTIIFLSHFYGLIISTNVDEIQVPLLSTGNSQTVENLFVRYTSTIVHVMNWYKFNPFDPRSKAYKSLKLVRGFHQQVKDKLNQIDQNKKENFLWMSQWNMIDAQFAFMGCMTLFPKQLGFHFFSKTDFHAIFHFWRVIGYCLGMEEDYNICSREDEEIIEICRQIYYQNFLPSINAGNDKIKMGEGIALATSCLSPLNDFNGIMRYGAPFMGLDKNRYPLDTILSKISYYFVCLSYNVLAKFRIYHLLTAWLFAPILWQGVMFGKIHKWICTIRYGKHRYETEATCPLKIHINYKSIFEERSLY